MAQKEKSIGVNATLNGLKTLLSVVFPLITYPYAARVLEVENMGKVNFSSSIVSYFILLAGLGVATYAIREGARVRDDKENLEQFASEMFSINAVSSAISLILLILVVLMVPRFRSLGLLITVQSVAILGNLVGISWLYSIVEDYAYITIRSLVVHIIAFVLLFLFVHNENDYVWYAATTVVANAGANVFNFFHAKKYINIRFTLKLNLKQHIKPILIIFASAVTTTIYVNSDKTILGFLASEYHVGLYSTAVNVYTVLKSCIAAIILVSLPRLSNYLAKGRLEDYKRTATDIFKMFIMILLPVMVGVYVTSDAIILIIGGESYTAAANSMRILSISLVFSLLASYYTNAVLLPYKKEWIVLKGTIISAVINVGLNFILLEQFKQDGAAFTTLLAEMFMCTYQYYYVRKKFKMDLSKRFIGSVLLGCCGIVAVSVVCDKLLLNFFVNLVLKIVGSVLLYATMLLGMKNETAISILGGIKSRILKRR